MLLSLILLFTVISNSKEKQFTQVLNTTSGPIRGVVSTIENKTVYKYLGIPYAKANRFEYPQKYNWTELFNGNHYGKPCPQTSSSFEIQHHETSENCLNLNIFVPDSKEKNLTVVVYIGGLFYSFGNANDTKFDPVAVASRGDVLLISLNNRLGIFGFASTGTEVLKGNYGLADQIESLKWLRRNVHSFGGNPDDVTVIGHWSGAMSVGLLLVSPKARGLFKHAILMSGSPLSLSATLDHVTARERVRKISEHLNCGINSNLKQCLKSKSVADLIMAQAQVHNVPILSPFAPVIDGDILTDVPEVLFKNGKRINAESVMIGMVEDDGAIFLSPSFPGATYNIGSLSSQHINRSVFYKIIQENKLSKFSAATSLVKYMYTNWNNPEDENLRLIDIYSDASFGAPAIQLANILSRKGIPTFLYHIQKNPFNASIRPRIPTGNDLLLMFDRAFTMGMRDGKARRTLGQAFRMLIEFVKTGNPTPPRDPSPLKWPTYTPEGKYLSIGKSNITIQSKFLSDRIAFWNELLPSMTSKSFTVYPTVLTNTSSHDNETKCPTQKDKASKALTAVVSVMAIVIIIMLSIIVYQIRMLSKRHEPPPSQQQEQ